MFFGCDLSAGMPFCTRFVGRLKLLKEFLRGKKVRRCSGVSLCRKTNKEVIDPYHNIGKSIVIHKIVFYLLLNFVSISRMDGIVPSTSVG